MSKLNFASATLLSHFLLVFIHQAELYSLSDGFKVIQSDSKRVIVEYSPELKVFQKITSEDGSVTFYPDIAGASLSGQNEGEPSHLVLTKSIAVPGPDLFAIESIDVGEIKYFDYIISPGGITGKIDNSLYNSYKLPSWATIEYAGIARNRYIALLKITAARYNSLTKKIEIPSKVIVKIKFNDVNQNNANAFLIDDYENASSINYKDSQKWIITPLMQDVEKNFKKLNNKNKILTTGNQIWLKIKIEEEGIYKIDASQLTDWGYNLSADDAQTIKIYGNGGKELNERVSEALNNKMNEQEIIVRTKQGGELDYILFYAKPAYGFKYDGGKFEHYINHFSKYNYYLLSWGGAPGKRASTLEPPDGAPVSEPMTYTEMLFHEEELYNPFDYPGSGREWLGRYIMSNSQSSEYSNVLYNIEPNSKISYRFSLAHKGDATGTFTVSESGSKILSIDIPPKGSYVYSVRRRISSESNSNTISNSRSKLIFDYRNTVVSASGFLDWFEIYYTRRFIPIDNQISFFGDPLQSGVVQYSVNGFQGGEILGFDVSEDSKPKLLKNLSQTGGMFIFKTTVEANNPKRFFISSRIKNVSIEKINIANLRTDFANTDIIIITHKQLIESAEMFKEYRTKQSNLSASIVLTEQIFNEFASGVPDPTAIRDFIAFAYNNWSNKPKYIVLWGDGHYDYKNIEYNTVNFVPPFESFENSDIFNGVESYTSDDFFVQIIGDDPIIDIPIGRLPVDSPENGTLIVEKIQHYENSSLDDNWKTNVTLVADDAWSSQSSSPEMFHTTQSEDLSELISDDIQQRKIYLAEYPKENIPNGKRKPLVPEDILSSVNTTGTLMLNWIGHGNPRVWAHEEALDRDIHIAQMQNIDRLFFMTAATCDYGRYDMADKSKRSGAEEMLLSKAGGSVGGFAATRLVYASDNAVINQKLYNQIFSRDSESGLYNRLGDVLFRVKVKEGMWRGNDQRYNLLGDPTLKLLIPEYIVKIDSIDGRCLDSISEPMLLKALTEVRIAATILKIASNEIVDSFDGIAVLTMLDGDENVKIEDTGWKDAFHNIVKHGGALNRSSYKVDNGRFTAQFIIPKDISYSNGRGRLYVYAYTADKRYAKGGTRKYIIDGIFTGNISDTSGPNIDIYLDSRNFKSFDIVRSTPLLIVDLNDKSGINTTGKGIGRKIEAWIDDNPNSWDLTSYFKTSLEEAGKGTVERILFRLEPGLHKIAVRAWDVYNNHSLKETYFKIQPNNGNVIYNFYNYPNPVSGEKITFKFSYNMNPPLQVRLNVYNSLGERVYSYSGNTINLQTSEISWDGKGDYGQSLSQGVYYYRLDLTDSRGSGTYSSGSLAIIK